MELEGKIAVVTGGGYGIGAAIATVLTRAGCDVAILGRDENALADRAALLTTIGKRILPRKCDISSWHEVRTVVAEVECKLGPIDILVNNAGGWAGDPLVQLAEQRLAELVDTIVKGTMYMSKTVLEGMIKRHSGFILNIGSTSGLPDSHDSAIASAPKAAIASMSHTLREEVQDFGIRVAVLHPGGVLSKPSIDAPLKTMITHGRYNSISAMQVAEVARYILTQPANVLIKELTMGPFRANA